MTRKLTLSFFIVVFTLIAAGQEKPLAKGMRITQSVKIKKAVYKIDAFAAADKAVLVIEGEDITVDFNNATLQGSNTKRKPDAFFGVAVIIRNSNRVTIKNLKAKGYKIGIYAYNTGSLTIDNCDFSYNYRQHLNSTPEKEDESDWLSYHNNEKNEWLRYGAGIYLDSCDLAIVRNTKVTNGQNGLLMRQSHSAYIFNNDFSFNSGVGIGLYRCNDNKVAYNRVIFNVRGYSHGVYSRGQDSAGILVYEQSSRNFFYKNAVTHGGDGFFLWAGQQTMNSGEGGSNDNILAENDFSYAPTNGVEITFSSNKVIHNRIFECEHGVWAGYSFNTEISSNSFRNNKTAIAIEHGQNIDIGFNIFLRDKEAIRLWAREKQPDDWIYAKKKDTRSRNYAIHGNSFYSVPVVYSVNRSENLKIFGNPVRDSMTIFNIDSATVENLDTSFDEVAANRLSLDSAINAPFADSPNDPFKGLGKFNGRKNIMITEWGPYNFQYPLVWLTNPTDTSGLLKFDIKGPAGKWKIKTVKGIDSVSARAGEMPASITARKQKAGATQVQLVLEFTGEAFPDAFGQPVPKTKPYLFYFRKDISASGQPK